MTAASAVMLAMLTINFASFSWAVPNHFRRNGAIPRGMRTISMLSLIGFGWAVWDVLQARLYTPWQVSQIACVAASIGMVTLSLGLFWWAVASTPRRRLSLACSTDTPETVVRDGPFTLVRHPFYTSYMMFWTGAALFNLDWAFAIYAAGMSCVYVREAHHEERKFMKSHLQGAYARYRSSTGMFLPSKVTRSRCAPRSQIG